MVYEELSPSVGKTMEHLHKKSVFLCETQPLTADGVCNLLSRTADMQYLGRAETLAGATEALRQQCPSVMLVDKLLGTQSILDWLALVKGKLMLPVEVVVWGLSITEAEALRFLQSGARGILRKSAEGEMVVACLRTVAGGANWMADSVFRGMKTPFRDARSELTPREQQVLELIEQGLKNKEIARELGIRPGTVKIHLKHIFEKTGVHGRFGLALSAIRQRGEVELARAS